MQKGMFLLLVGLCLIFSSAFQAEAGDEGKVSGTLVYRGNVISPDEGKSFWSHDLNAYIRMNEKLGIGLDTTSCPENNYLNIKPYATWKLVDGLNLVGGLSTNSKGADYAHAGVWYFSTLGKNASIFVDPRFYFEASDDAKNYFDGFAEFNYSVSSEVSLAINVIYDHWWQSQTDWALVGPVVYWKINKSTTLFSRIARETNFEGGNATDLRIGLKFNF